MPRETKRYFIMLALVLAFAASASAQSTPTSGDVMRGRIMRAKALIATRNHNAAIFELENIRRETADAAVHGVVNVLLMHCYLEQGDYRRAHDFLDGFFDSVKNNKPNASNNYYLVAGQVVKGARMQSERYKSLGLMAADKNLPNEAGNDLEKMRDMLERVVEQAKNLGRDKQQSASAFSLLEEATNTRSMLARDDYDTKRWKEELADARELLTTSRSVILSAVEGESSMPVTDTVAQIPPPPMPKWNPTPGPSEKQTVTVELISIPVVEEKKIAEPVKEGSSSSKPVRDRRVIKSPQWEKGTSPEAESETAVEPLEVGALAAFAIEKPQATYPSTARSLRVTGVVRIELIVEEDGTVLQITNVKGPGQLTSAAIDAALKWRFKPFKKDGKATRATGFLDFNFTL